MGPVSYARNIIWYTYVSLRFSVKMTRVTPYREVFLEMNSLSTTDIQAIRQSWDLAKAAAPFETHGPAFYNL